MDVIVRLHGLPDNITSDRDAMFLSTFWQELFSLQVVQLNLSLAYHPRVIVKLNFLIGLLGDLSKMFLC